MSTAGYSLGRFASGRSARRAFTFIELIVAIALSVILLRGMYSVFGSATDLTRVSEERMDVMLEASALFDFITDDLARAPLVGGQEFSLPGTDTLIFKATNRSAGGDPVYIRYEYVSSGDYGKLVRSVYKEMACSSRADDDGDGQNDPDMVIARQISAFEVRYHASGEIDGTWSTGNVMPPDTTRAIRFHVKMGSSTPASQLADETFTFVVPIMFLP